MNSKPGLCENTSQSTTCRSDRHGEELQHETAFAARGLTLALALTAAAERGRRGAHAPLDRVSALETKVNALQHVHAQLPGLRLGADRLVRRRARSTLRLRLRQRRSRAGPGAEFYTSALDIAPNAAESTFVVAIVDEDLRLRKVAARSVTRARRARRARSPALEARGTETGSHRRSRLDLDDDGEDHRPPAGAVVDELADGVVDVLLEELQLAHVRLRRQLGDRALDLRRAPRRRAGPARRSRARSAPAATALAAVRGRRA